MKESNKIIKLVTWLLILATTSGILRLYYPAATDIIPFMSWSVLIGGLIYAIIVSRITHKDVLSLNTDAHMPPVEYDLMSTEENEYQKLIEILKINLTRVFNNGIPLQYSNVDIDLYEIFLDNLPETLCRYSYAGDFREFINIYGRLFVYDKDDTHISIWSIWPDVNYDAVYSVSVGDIPKLLTTMRSVCLNLNPSKIYIPSDDSRYMLKLDKDSIDTYKKMESDKDMVQIMNERIRTLVRYDATDLFIYSDISTRILQYLRRA